MVSHVNLGGVTLNSHPGCNLQIALRLVSDSILTTEGSFLGMLTMAFTITVFTGWICREEEKTNKPTCDNKSVRKLWFSFPNPSHS